MSAWVMTSPGILPLRTFFQNLRLFGSSVQTPLSAFTQPTSESHESLVQGFSSSQFGAPPPTHEPEEQVSDWVQASPSSHEPELLTCTQPLAGLHESSVQTLPSSQLEEMSVYWQPKPATHESEVQAFPSSQTVGPPPMQIPPLQASFVVQTSPSLQGLVLFTWTQPLDGLQESVVQGLPSSQSADVSVCWQPEPGRHESAVHASPSSQFVGPPDVQPPPLQASPVVQALPSSQGLVLFVCTQPVPESHESSVHALVSSQPSAGPPWHEPPLQASFVVQASPSSHDAELWSWPQAPEPSHSSSVHAYRTSTRLNSSH